MEDVFSSGVEVSMIKMRDLTPEKTQEMLISRRQRPPDTPIPSILWGWRLVPQHTSLSILGLEVNSVLTFTGHIRPIARKAAWNSAVSGVSHTFLTPKGSPPYTQPKAVPLWNTPLSRGLLVPLHT
ncbi:hypothetical protein GWK47_044926 [Chionoecetes opilio]|uniref:Uncharacterized protein n=1 Tax=Chionoecetes opilio TaxID=41210 RepID=A0A8J4YG13_CHIOP|nr:hypothetical protein GWK47_044926 [Chionoecetes opilio]